MRPEEHGQFGLWRNRGKRSWARNVIASKVSRFFKSKYIWSPGRVVRERRRDGSTAVVTYSGRYVRRPMGRRPLTPRG